METMLLFNFLGPEMLVVLFAILLLFGGKKIPELMRGIGKGIREFNSARSTIESELKEGMKEEKRVEEKSSEKQAQPVQEKISPCPMKDRALYTFELNQIISF
eukprot:TRINITY_DN19834_c0_g1_i1.p1 TRINITY_DN19834_c0_g1~~TRINITY_DN19834_c0_g1_i1.p1  ORF type:complete len:103 (-),score=15.00 TRINITY_DN19834_c0_g1_i1:120-428(-)